MQKINLIPASYFEQQKIKRLIGIFGAILGLVILGMLGATLLYSSKIKNAEEELARVEPIAVEVERLKSEASAVRSEVEPIRAKITFIEDHDGVQPSMIPILTELAQYTYKRITYTRVAPSDDGGTLTINGWAPSLEDAGRYIMTCTAQSISSHPSRSRECRVPKRRRHGRWRRRRRSGREFSAGRAVGVRFHGNVQGGHTAQEADGARCGCSHRCRSRPRNAGYAGHARGARDAGRGSSPASACALVSWIG